MNTKHTPGPWHWHDLGNDWCVSGANGDNAIVAPDRKPSTADARLIAAAPELLAALERIAAWKTDWRIDEAIVIARAAIAKATA